MRSGRKFINWRAVVGVLAVGALAFGLKLEGASVSSDSASRIVGEDALSVDAKKTDATRVKLGTIPSSLPVLPVSTANPYDDEPSRLRAAGLLKGPMPLFGYGKPNANNVAATGDPCTFDIQCEDGDPCTDDFCDINPGAAPGTGVCNNEIVPNDDVGDINGDNCSDGLVCNGQETCQGATVIACEGVCSGGSNDGEPCIRETDCPTGGTCLNQVCADDGTTPCTDNSQCGSITGACQAPGNGNDPIVCTSPQVCDENADPVAACVDPCDSDAFCDDDLACTGVETCDLGTGLCSSPGNPCGAAAATCLEGICKTAGPDFNNSECVGDVDCGIAPAAFCDLNGPHCFAGRCCDGSGTLIKDGFGLNPDASECDAAGGNWYPGDTGSISQQGDPPCPNYSSGIGDPGEYFVTVGPASLSPFPDPVTGAPLRKLGDDYDTGETDFLRLQLLRFAGGVSDGSNSRIAFEFYDENGNFVEDVFFISNQGTQGTQVVQVFALAPTLTIPPRGFIVGHVLQSFASNVTARGEFFWLSTDVVDSGTNDANTLYVDTDLDGIPSAVSNFLGVCNGGDRDGLQCGGSLTCPGGSSVCDDGSPCTVDGDCTGIGLSETCNTDGCVPVPGVLAFELEAFKTADAPRGGCCDPNTQSCDTLLQWECNGAGGNYLGDNVLCAACGEGSPNIGAPCRTCTGGANDGLDCEGAADCPDGTCDLNDSKCGLCDDFATPCTVDGDCTGIGSELCNAGSCDLNAVCLTGACCLSTTGECVDGETLSGCDDQGGTFQGLGTDCDPDCCVQPTLSGANDCETAPVTELEIPDTAVCLRGPNKGDTCVSVGDCGGFPCERTVLATLTGNNSTASSTFDDQDSCFLPQDSPGAELGWFEKIQIVDPSVRADDTIPCGYLLVDHCCTDPVKIPAYRILYNSCPCGPVEFTKPNPNHPERLADARGAPFCLLDNAWQQFGPLVGAGDSTEVAAGVGTYWYPIFSSFGGNFDEYQFHVRLEACPDAVCCVGTDCKIVNILECQAQGGFFLAPPNRGDAVTVCGSICDTGSCCTGPGECVDNQAGGDPPDSQIDMTPTFCTDTLDGTYVGGVKCFGGTCQGGSQQNQSCQSDNDCSGGTCVGDSLDLAQPSPCPICEIRGPGNCQVFDDGVVQRPSDVGRPGGGVTVADDFIPLSDTIDALCTWGTYTESDSEGNAFDCSGGFNNKFRVRIYGADEFGLPDTGNVIAERAIPADAVTQVKVENSASELLGGIPVFGYQIDLSDNPITDLDTASTCYWLEIVNDGDGACGWNWQTVDTTNNDFSAIGGAGAYGPASARNGDMAFCLSTPFQPGACGTPIGYCCNCRTGGGGTCENTDRRSCVDQKQRWRIDLTCETATGNDVCEESPPSNDLCDVVASAGFDDTPAGTTLFDNTCANTDGVNPVTSEIGGGNAISADIWFKFIATEAGPITISTCATGPASGGGVDTIIAAFRDPDNPTSCICPGDDAAQTAATNWYSEPAGIDVHSADENCDGELNGAGGFIVGEVLPGDCIMIRLGGFGGQGSEEGAGTVTITSVAVDVPPAPVAVGGGNRYIEIDAPAPATAGVAEEVIRVRPLSLNHSGTAESVYYVGTPFQASEEDSSQPGLTFTAAPLTCDPVAHTWSSEDVISIFGAEILPGSEYAVERALATCSDLATNDDCWSEAATLTTLKYGDNSVPFDGPGNPVQPDFGDINGLVFKFLAQPGAPEKAICQLQPNVVFPSRAIDFKDINADVGAFLGTSYESVQFGPCTCPSAVACGTACASDTECTGGLCVNGECGDECGRCAP